MYTREPGESVDVYAVIPSGAVADNYSIVMLPGTLTIKPRQLVITADTLTKEYGTSDTDLSFTITSGSLVGSDTISGHLQREPGENVGTYAILQDTLTAGDNYVVTLVAGTLVITPYAEPTAYGSVRNGFDEANSGQVSFIAEPAEGYGFAYWSDGHTVFCTQPELINPPGGIDAYQAIMWPMGPTTDKKIIVMSTEHESICEFLDGKISMILPKHVDPESVIAVTAVADPSGNAATPAGMTGLSVFYHMLRSENLVDSTIRIVIDLEKSGISLSDSEQQTLKLYHWNSASAVWETVSITAQGFDAATGTLWAEVDNFSTFGLFYTADELPQTGEKIPVSPWLFLILAAGLAIILYSRRRLAGRL
jgi:LPXTG-motif cell wall-anchored protein